MDFSNKTLSIHSYIEIYNNTHSKALWNCLREKETRGNRWCWLFSVDWGVSEKQIISLVVGRGSKRRKMLRGHCYLSIYLSVCLPWFWIYLCISHMSCLVLFGHSSYSCVQLHSDLFHALLSYHSAPFLLFFTVSCVPVSSHRLLAIFVYQ